jgi:hypothetical protein
MNVRMLLSSFAGLSALALLAAPAWCVTFSNSSPVTVPGAGTAGVANVYPATISVSGLAGTIFDVNVSLLGISHEFPRDIDVLLVGPTGASIALMTDVGGMSAVSNVNLVFDDAALMPLLPNATMFSGTWRPSDSDVLGIGEPDTWTGAPAGPYGTALSAFHGLEPNGTYSLYVVDDGDLDVGEFAGGWSIDLVTVPEPTNALLLPMVCMTLLGRWQTIGRRRAQPGIAAS